MLPKKITSLQHPLVKECVELRKNRSIREEKKLVFLSGENIIREYTGIIEKIFSLAPSKLKAKENILVTEEILKKITGLEQPDGLAALVPLPNPQDLSNKKRILILDQIQDPGNLGTLLRTALSFGWEGVIATPGTVDFFNEKALRSAQGATFKIPFCWQTEEEILSCYPPQHLFVADKVGENFENVSPDRPIYLILSNEGSGPQAWAEKKGSKISIPMQNRVESLNVAIAGAILLYALREKS